VGQLVAREGAAGAPPTVAASCPSPCRTDCGVSAGAGADGFGTGAEGDRGQRYEGEADAFSPLVFVAGNGSSFGIHDMSPQTLSLPHQRRFAAGLVPTGEAKRWRGAACAASAREAHSARRIAGVHSRADFYASEPLRDDRDRAAPADKAFARPGVSAARSARLVLHVVAVLLIVFALAESAARAAAEHLVAIDLVRLGDRTASPPSPDEAALATGESADTATAEPADPVPRAEPPPPPEATPAEARKAPSAGQLAVNRAERPSRRRPR